MRQLAVTPLSRCQKAQATAASKCDSRHFLTPSGHLGNDTEESQLASVGVPPQDPQDDASKIASLIVSIICICDLPGF
jgi:hypothetical protein